MTVPGLPHDGAPLTFDEQRALADVEMDAMIGVPEPVYSTEGEV
jgi:hypothetical protein